MQTGGDCSKNVSSAGRRERMREAAHYTVVLAVWPMALLLVGLLIAVGIDSYIRKHQKRIMLIICAPVFRLLIDKKPFNEALFGRDSIVFFVICTVVEVIAYCVRQVKKAGKQ